MLVLFIAIVVVCAAAGLACNAYIAARLYRIDPDSAIYTLVGFVGVLMGITPWFLVFDMKPEWQVWTLFGIGSFIYLVPLYVICGSKPAREAVLSWNHRRTRVGK